MKVKNIRHKIFLNHTFFEVKDDNNPFLSENNTKSTTTADSESVICVFCSTPIKKELVCTQLFELLCKVNIDIYKRLKVTTINAIPLEALYLLPRWK